MVTGWRDTMREGQAPAAVRDVPMTSLKEPPAVEFDLLSQSFKQHPFPTLARLREQGPVIRLRFPLFGKAWMATTYDAVNDLLRDHHHFVQNPITAGNRWVGAILRWLPGTLQPLATNMLLRDPPDHRRLRSLVDQAIRLNRDDRRAGAHRMGDDRMFGRAKRPPRNPGPCRCNLDRLAGAAGENDVMTPAQHLCERAPRLFE